MAIRICCLCVCVYLFVWLHREKDNVGNKKWPTHRAEQNGHHFSLYMCVFVSL